MMADLDRQPPPPASAGPTRFWKMHGLGNDFVILDGRAGGLALTQAGARRLADRHFGIGCDQVIALFPATETGAQVAMRIFNADGSEVMACGNATRCVARLLFEERAGQDGHVTIETGAGLLAAFPAAFGDKFITVDMGVARTGWREIPLSSDVDTLHLPLAADGLRDGVAVSMGNPHAVFFVDDVVAVDLARLGPRLENDPLFPERANIGVAQITGKDRMRLRVWERGAGLTLACGTGASAAAVAARRRGLARGRIEITLDGGTLWVETDERDHVLMTGPAGLSFTGTLGAALQAGTETP